MIFQRQICVLSVDYKDLTNVESKSPYVPLRSQPLLSLRTCERCVHAQLYPAPHFCSVRAANDWVVTLSFPSSFAVRTNTRHLCAVSLLALVYKPTLRPFLLVIFPN
jgi:hypothetical protein